MKRCKTFPNFTVFKQTAIAKINCIDLTLLKGRYKRVENIGGFTEQSER